MISKLFTFCSLFKHIVLLSVVKHKLCICNGLLQTSTKKMMRKRYHLNCGKKRVGLSSMHTLTRKAWYDSSWTHLMSLYKCQSSVLLKIRHRLIFRLKPNIHLEKLKIPYVYCFPYLHKIVGLVHHHKWL